jgi:hypothetical protein
MRDPMAVPLSLSSISEASQKRASACALLTAVIFVTGLPGAAKAAEFGSSPYPKGFRDIFAGIIPSAPGDKLSGQNTSSLTPAPFSIHHAGDAQNG